jgi:hypothetical protein
MMKGDGDVVSGWRNKLQSAIAAVTPADMRIGEPEADPKPSEIACQVASRHASSFTSFQHPGGRRLTPTTRLSCSRSVSSGSP